MPDLTTPRSRGRRGGNSGWPADRVLFPESEPQWYTVGNDLPGTTVGPGSDDAVLPRLEDTVARSAITRVTDYFDPTYGKPSRNAMCVSAEVQLYEDVPFYRAHRVFMISNSGFNEEGYAVRLTMYLSNGHDIVSQDEYEGLELTDDPAEDVAVALADIDAETSEVLCFEQFGGTVTCTVVRVAAEDKNLMTAYHWERTNPVLPYSFCLDRGATTTVASGGRTGDTAKWAELNLGSDTFFSSMQAMNIGAGRVLLLHLKTDGSVTGYVLGCTDGIVTTLSTTAVLPAGSAVNLYQMVPSVNGLIDGTRDRFAVTWRAPATGTGGAAIMNVDAANVITIEAQISLDADQSHAAWCRDRVVILTKDTYSVPNSAYIYDVGFGPSSPFLRVYDQALNQLTVIDGAAGVVNTDGPGLLQIAGCYGWANGRLYMHAAGTEPDSKPDYQYAYYGSGLRLYVLEGDTLVLQDQLPAVPGVNPVASEMHPITEDAIIVCGRDQEFYDSGQPVGHSGMFTVYYAGGALREGNSDQSVHRISDEWVVIVSPEKNGYWRTTNETPVWDASPQLGWPIEESIVRAVHINGQGVPDKTGRSTSTHMLGSWYAACSRIDDTHFMIISTGSMDEKDYVDGLPGRFYMRIFEINEETADVTVVATRPYPGEVGDPDHKVFRAYAPGGQATNDPAGVIFGEVGGPYAGVSLVGGGRRFRLPAGTWRFDADLAIPGGVTGTTSVSMYDLAGNLIATRGNTGLHSSPPFASGPTFYVTHDAPFDVVVRVDMSPITTVDEHSYVTITPGHTWFVTTVIQTTETSRRFVMFSRTVNDPPHGIRPDTPDIEMTVTTFDLDATDWSTTVLDEKVIDPYSAGGIFSERKVDGLTQLSPSKYVATYPHDTAIGHMSAHCGVLVDANGQITSGTPVQSVADPDYSSTIPQNYGIQGTWMHAGMGNHGRYIYPCGNWWVGSHTRFPRINFGSFGVSQRIPGAVAVMDVDDVTGDLDITMYPLRVRREDIDEEWYDANQFFADAVYTDGATPPSCANVDGYQWEFYNTSQVMPGASADEFWLFQGTEPIPALEELRTGFGIAKYTLNHTDESADYVPDTFACMGLPYWLPYAALCTPLRADMFALIGHFSYIGARSGPQGDESGYGTGTLRIFDAAGRGFAAPGPNSKRAIAAQSNKSGL